MVPSIPIHKTDITLITFPEQITLPRVSSVFECSSTFVNLIKSVKCDLYPEKFNTVRV